MVQTKLHVNINQGIVDVEGDETFVLRVYEDFKEALLSARHNNSLVEAKEDHHESVSSGAVSSDGSRQEAARHSRKPRIQRSVSNGGVSNEKVKSYSPSLDKSLNTKDLPAFFESFAPKNNPERILIFARFLDDKLRIKPCTGDHIFTCYRTLKEKIPGAFVQALRDASGGRYGYINYRAPSEIVVTVRGDNHFDHGIKRKEAE